MGDKIYDIDQIASLCAKARTHGRYDVINWLLDTTIRIYGADGKVVPIRVRRALANALPKEWLCS